MRVKTIIFISAIFSLLLVLSCMDHSSSGYRVEPGRGLFYLTVHGDNSHARTIQPNEQIDYSALFYTLSFTQTAPVTQTLAPINRVHSELGEPVELAEGTYSLTVTGFSDSARTIAVARGFTAGIVIDPEGATDGLVILRAIMDGAGNGTFSWNISFTSTGGFAALTQAKMEIEGPYGAASTVRSYTIVSTAPGTGQVTPQDSLDLPSGSYYVTITLSRENLRDVIWLETLQVYQNLTSSYTQTFSDDHFLRLIHTVTYDPNGGTGSPVITSYLHETPITLINLPGTITRTGYTFGGGWLEGSTIGTFYPVDDPYTVNNSVVFYARWTKDLSVIQHPFTYINNDGAITPIVSGTTYTETASFKFEITGFETQENAEAVGLTVDAESGLTISGTAASADGISGTAPDLIKTFTVTIALDAGGDFSWGTGNIYITGITGAPDYTPIDVLVSLVNVRDGLAEFTGIYDRRIPVNQDNINYFNTYAGTTAGLTRCYYLTENITLTVPATGSNWTPIAESTGGTVRFTGVFDGNNKTISGITMRRGPYTGMFGTIEGTGNGTTTGIVKNLGLINLTINFNSMYFGGIAGAVYGGKIINCFVNGNITAASYVGGIVGNLQNGGVVQNCYTTGSVAAGTASASNNAGGIVGNMGGTDSKINNCFSTSTIIGNSNVGGIVGARAGTNDVSNNVALNKSVTATSATGVAGRVFGSGAGDIYITNLAFIYMTVNGSIIPTTSSNNINGAGITFDYIITQSRWESGAAFTFGGSPWTWNGTTHMPSLHGETILWPDHLKTGAAEVKLELWLVEDGKMLDSAYTPASTISANEEDGLPASLTARVTSGVYDDDGIQWYLNGSPLTGQTGIIITISAAGLNGGQHNLDVVVKRGGISYSKRISFYVKPQTWTVQFVSNRGVVIPPQSVVSGSTIPSTAKSLLRADTDENSFYNFAGWYREDTLTTPWDSDNDKVTAPVTLYAKWIPTASVGDIGPGGGRIFHKVDDGFDMQGYGNPEDPGYFATYRAHYLEAAPAGWYGGGSDPSLAWATSGFVGHAITGLSQTGSETICEGLGRGRLNTALILAEDSGAPAANVCNTYSDPNDKNDWFLPSRVELRLYRDSTVTTDKPTAGNTYWSSTQTRAVIQAGGDIRAIIIDFEPITGVISNPVKNTISFVRPIRAW